MDCNKTYENNINEAKFDNQIVLAIECISKVQNITNKDFNEISNDIFDSSINGREQTKCLRKIYEYEKDGFVIGTLECYMALDKSFIEIFHH